MRRNDVKVLSEIEHVLHRPGMYVGDVTCGIHDKWIIDSGRLVKRSVKVVPALLKLFDEIISNSIDEGFRTDFKYANEIKVSIEDNGKITIEDNGRGIPVVESNIPGKTQAELAFTNLRAGANFEDEGHVSIGTHGLGSTLVNILSRKFIAKTDDGNMFFRLHCSHNMSDIDTELSASKGKKGTVVSFFPDYKRLGLPQLDKNHIQLIEKRLHDLSICFPQIKFKYNGRLIKSTNFKHYLQQINENFEILESEKFKVAILPSDSGDQISFINGIDTFGGGVHVDIVSNDISTSLRDAIKRKYKVDIRLSDIKNKCLFVIVTNSIGDPKFDSQTKERLTNNTNEIRPVFDGVDDPNFIKKILKNEEIIQPIIEALLLKKQLAEARALRKAQKAGKKKKVSSHIVANGSDPDEKILFLTEGLSAISNLINVRNPKIHGGFPLKGKVRNVRDMKPTDIVKNVELHDIMNILGIEIGEPAVDLNYGRIGILADADYDGFSISALLVNFFSMWPELFDEDRVVLIKSPIVIARKGKTLKRFYDMAEFESAKLSSSWSIEYNKGLGSLSLDEYDLMINKPEMDVIKYDDQGTQSLQKAFGNDSSPRKTWLLT